MSVRSHISETTVELRQILCVLIVAVARFSSGGVAIPFFRFSGRDVILSHNGPCTRSVICTVRLSLGTNKKSHLASPSVPSACYPNNRRNCEKSFLYVLLQPSIDDVSITRIRVAYKS